MPRPIPNPQGFNKLPGELVLLILRNLLEEPDISSQTVKTLIKRSMFLARLSWKFKNSTDQIIGLHFHEYLQPNNCGVHDNIAPFHVHPMEGVARQRDYWRHFLGNDALKAPQTRDILNSLTGGRLPALRCVSVDLRAQEPHTQSSLRLWKTKHAPRWIQTSAILSRIGAVSRGIEELNVRLSPQQDLIDLVQDIIVANKRLHTIRIEVDSAVVNGRNDKPSINLHDMFPNTETRAHLRVFMIRAPSCDVHLTGTGREQQERFFDRLHHVEEFTLACSVFNAAAPTLSWLLQLLRHMSKIRFFDFAISSRERNHVPLPDDEAAVPTAILHNLEKMSVQIPEVDGHLFRAVKAPALYKIRIYSEIHIDNWPESDSNQFPNLFIVNISCPGPSAVRIRALGVPYKAFSQNLGVWHNWSNDHSRPFLAYLRPYSFRRFPPPPPPHPWAPPPPLSDDTSELTELSDSEGLWPDSTPTPLITNTIVSNEDDTMNGPLVSQAQIPVQSVEQPSSMVEPSDPSDASEPSPTPEANIATASSSSASALVSPSFAEVISHLANDAGPSSGFNGSAVSDSSNRPTKRRRYALS